MRTNPFYDAWLFIIGSTPDHEKLGAFKYLFVALFLVLIAASLWIAGTNWRADASQRAGVHVTTFVCRVLIGCQWFQGCLWKLPLPVSGTFEYWAGEMRENAAFAFHRALVEAVYLPNLKIIDPLVFLAELSFAISLLLGIGVRLFALLAVAFSLHLWLGLYLQQQEWPWNYVFLAIIHALFVAYAAGRSFGADALLRRRADSNSLVGRLLALAS
jgi:TQO small subunit DoxD